MNNTGQYRGYDIPTDDGSLDNQYEPSCYNPFQQQTAGDQDIQPPTVQVRHDSINPQLSPLGPQYRVRQQKAESQPHIAQSTPHTSNAYLIQSEMMSRGASYTSQYSSTSSGQHYTESPHFASHHSLPNIWSPNGIGMQRSASLHSNASFLYSQQQSPQLDASPLHQLHDDFLTNSSSAIFSPATQYRPSTVYLDESAISCSPSHPTDAFNLVFGNLGHSNR
jgi:hypothetical protein